MKVDIEQFDKEFVPLHNPIDPDASLDGAMFETYGKELEYVLKWSNNPLTENRVWTYIDGDDGTYIISGYHLVNRIGYILTENPFTEETQVKLGE